MKKLSLILFLALSSPLFAQEGDEVGWVGRFGAAGGFSPVYVFPNVNPVNDLVKQFGISGLSTSGMFTWGGSGYAYIMIIDNLRIGGMGISGSISTTGTSEGFNKEVDYSYGLGGLTVEYTLPFINRIAVSVGTIIGVGSSSIQFYKNQDNYIWEGITSPPPFSSRLVYDLNVSRKYTNTFFTITPTLNVDIPLNRFIAFRVGGGYVFSFNNEWKVDNNQILRGVPSDLKSNSFFVQTGIYFGLFAF